MFEQEFGLIEARYLTRANQAKRPASEIHAAIGQLLASVPSRPDMLRPAIDAAITLDNGKIADYDRSLNRARILAAAQSLARVAPTDPRSWCIFAVADAQEREISPKTLELLKACFDVGPRSVGVIEMRVLLVLSAWGAMPQDFRNRALNDIANALSERNTQEWMADLLASTVVTLAPDQIQLVTQMVDQYAPESRPIFDRGVRSYRQKATAKSAPVPKSPAP